MIQAEHLRKSFGSIVAVEDVSFEIREGEAFGLLGPNGAGKTTTLSMLVGLLDPDSGTVRLSGGLDPRHPQTRQQIGIAPQSLSLYDELTALENLVFFGRLFGLSGKALNDRVKWCLDFAGLTDRQNDRVTVYSGGMKRRLNLAAALIHEPRIVLLDEPTVGVDPQSRNHLFERIEGLKQRGLTVIYTTHYMEEAERLCDRVAIMDHGRILAVDTVPKLIAAHGGETRVQVDLVETPDSTISLPGKLEGRRLEFSTHDPIAALLQWRESGAAFSTFQVKRPTLEAVFLNLTGRALRDE